MHFICTYKKPYRLINDSSNLEQSERNNDAYFCHSCRLQPFTHMALLLFSLLMLVQIVFYTCDNVPLNNSNCSLLFNIQRIQKSNTIETNFPIEFLGKYNLTCNVPNLAAYYTITPLSGLVNGYYEYENVKSMIKSNTTIQFVFNINQSLTYQLCILSHDNGRRLCRQIRMGINTLHEF